MLPTYKDQARPESNKTDGEQRTTDTNNPRNASAHEFGTEFNERGPVVVFGDEAVLVNSANRSGMPIAEGVGVLVDEIYELSEIPEPLASPPPPPPPPQESSVHSGGTNSGNDTEQVKSPGLLQKYKMCWLLLVALAVVAGGSVAGVCGSGACGMGGGDGTATVPTNNNGEQSPDVPVRPPIVVRGTLPYFTSTEELYLVVDEYMNAVYYSNGTDARALQANVTDQYGAIADWDVSRLTNFAFVFNRAGRASSNEAPLDTAFNEDISGWNVSGANTMEGMFSGALNFSQNLSQWDTARVISMKDMFRSAASFNGELLGWNVASVVDFSGMFYLCSSFQGMGLSSWNTGSAKDMTGMFFNTTSLSTNLSLWNVGQVTSMDSTFYGSNFNGNLASWNTSSVQTMTSMVRHGAKTERDATISHSAHPHTHTLKFAVSQRDKVQWRRVDLEHGASHYNDVHGTSHVHVLILRFSLLRSPTFQSSHKFHGVLV